MYTDYFGNTISTKECGSTCRCPMCGRNDADTNRVGRSYREVHIGKDEYGHDFNGLNKKETRKLRRVREARQFSL